MSSSAHSLAIAAAAAAAAVAAASSEPPLPATPVHSTQPRKRKSRTKDAGEGKEAPKSAFPLLALTGDTLSCVIGSLLGCDGLRVWRNVAEDLLNLRLVCRRLRSEVDAAAGLPRLEAALIAWDEDKPKRRFETWGWGDGPKTPIQAPSFQELPTLEVAGTTYKRPSAELDALLRSTERLRALSDDDLLALHRLYGAPTTEKEHQIRPPTMQREEAPPKPLTPGERARAITEIQSRLPPRFFGLSAEGARFIRHDETHDRTNKTDARERYALTAKEVAQFPYVEWSNPASSYYQPQHMIELWRLLDFCRKKYGSPEALEAEKVKKQEAKVRRRENKWKKQDEKRDARLAAAAAKGAAAGEETDASDYSTGAGPGTALVFF